MKHVYIQCNGTRREVFESAADALEPFVTTRGDWQVYLNDNDVVVPVTPGNTPAILRNIENFGYVEFRQVQGQITKVPFNPVRGGDRRRTPRKPEQLEEVTP